MGTLGDVLAAHTWAADPALVEAMDDGWVRCHACAHECPIADGAPGTCKVRFNQGGTLRVPWGYVAGAQSDPIEKKPFFHVIICGDILGFLVTGAVLNLFASPSTSPYLGLNPFYHLIVGGAAFGIAYMTTDPVSAPALPEARWIYGFLIGMLTVLIRVFNPAFPAGIGIAILFMNCFAPLLDEIQVKARLKNTDAQCPLA